MTNYITSTFNVDDVKLRGC